MAELMINVFMTTLVTCSSILIVALTIAGLYSIYRMIKEN